MCWKPEEQRPSGESQGPFSFLAVPGNLSAYEALGGEVADQDLMLRPRNHALWRRSARQDSAAPISNTLNPQ
ncbi:protein of unknown function [Burkholderia multivorans]